MERMSKTMAEGKEDLERAFNIMNEELLKAEYKARVDYYGKSMNEIMEEVAKETKSYKELEEENKKLKKECEENDYLVEDNARWMKECEKKIMEIKKLKEELQWWKDLVHKAKEFKYDEDGMDYIWQNTKI